MPASTSSSTSRSTTRTGIPTLVRVIDRHPYRPFIRHVDFVKVNLTEKVQAEVTLHFVGTPWREGGRNAQPDPNSITVEALPAEIPTSSKSMSATQHQRRDPYPRPARHRRRRDPRRSRRPAVSVTVLAAEPVPEVEEGEGEEGAEGEGRRGRGRTPADAEDSESASRVRLIVGLRNPGSEYQGTRHNLGYEVVAEFGRRHQASSEVRCASEPRSPAFQRGCDPAGPDTFMNDSGRAVTAALLLQGRSDDLLVLHDDIDLAFGRLRVQKVGGGRRQQRNPVARAASRHRDFWRLKLGVGRPRKSGSRRSCSQPVHRRSGRKSTSWSTMPPTSWSSGSRTEPGPRNWPPTVDPDSWQNPIMPRLDAIGIVVSSMGDAMEFYRKLGLDFPPNSKATATSKPTPREDSGSCSTPRT